MIRKLSIALALLAFLLLDPMDPLRAQFRLPGGITRRAPATTSARQARANPDDVCPPLVNWVKTLSTEYPGQDFMHIETSRLAKMEIPLFADPLFVPVFHKRYADLSPQELDGIFRRQFIPCLSSPYRTQLPEVSAAFQIHGTSPISLRELPAALTALETARADLAQKTTDLAAIPAITPTGYASVKTVDAAAAPSLALVWPSERAAFAKTIADTQARLAPAALQSKIRALSARDPSIDTLTALQDEPTADAELFRQVAPEIAAEEKKKLKEQSDAVGKTLLAKNRTTMLAFSGTKQGLKDGAAWLDQFESTFQTKLHVPGAAGLIAEYQQRREKQLAAGEPQLRRTIQTTASEYALKPLLEGAFPLPSDRTTPLYTRMEQLAQARAAVLAKRESAAAIPVPRTATVASARPTAHGGQSKASVASEGDAGSLATQGLANEQLFTAFYRGKFEDISFERGNLLFGSLLGSYMDTYWDRCSNYLPAASQVPITVQECATTSTPVNKWGTPRRGGNVGSLERPRHG